MNMPLDYLDFDYSEDEEGTGTLDAMACVAPAQLSALQTEVCQVLQWAHRHYAQHCAPLEEGGVWQYDLQAVQEPQTPLAIAYDEHSGQLQLAPGPRASARTTVCLSVSGTASFCAHLREHFGIVV